MSEEQNDNQLSPEETEEIYKRQRPLAFRIAKEAVKLANLPLYDPNDEPFTNLRWRVSYGEVNQDIALTIELNPIFTRAVVHSSLGLVAWEILRELELLFSNPRALKTLAVEDFELEDTIFEKASQLTRDYIFHLPFVIFHSFHQNLNEAIISHIKKFVDSDLREYWDKIGKPQKNFTLLPNTELKDIERLFPETNFQLIKGLQAINEEFLIYRKGALSNRKVWLNNPEAIAKLPSEYEQLKIQYKEAKREYKLQYEAFKTINPRANNDKWIQHWEKVYDEKFPNIYQTELPNYSASSLAYRQLADTFDFSAEYMEKIVRNAKAKANREEQERDEKSGQLK